MTKKKTAAKKGKKSTKAKDKKVQVIPVKKTSAERRKESEERISKIRKNAEARNKKLRTKPASKKK